MVFSFSIVGTADIAELEQFYSTYFYAEDH